MRRVTRLRSRDDAGATIVLVTLVITFMLLGVGAIVLNTGTWFAERAQLQNGSDAGALAVAKSCAAGKCDTTLATAIASKNANDNQTTVDVVCGSSPNSSVQLTPCLPSQQDGHFCPSAPASGKNYVNVHTITPTSQSLPVVGQLTGTPKRLKACAQAVWGTSGGAVTLPVTISECDWYKATSNGSVYATPPPYSPPASPWPARWPAQYTPYNAKQLPMPTPGGEDVLPLQGTATTSTSWDFENGQPDVDAWTFAPKKKGPTGLATTVKAHTGSYSMQITWGSDAAGGETVAMTNQQTISGQPYKFSAWVYVPVGSAPVALYVNGASGPVTLSPASQVGDNTWHQLSATFTAGNNVDVGVKTAAASTAGQGVLVDTAFLGLTKDPTCLGAAVTPASGFDMPGGFGWLYDPNANCSVTVNANNTIFNNTGGAVDPSCPTVLANAACDPSSEPTPPCQPQPLFVPVFDGFCSNSSTTCSMVAACGNTPNQSNGCYHVAGFAEFYLSGYQLTGQAKQNSSVTNIAYCTGNDKCMYGFFTRGLVDKPGPICTTGCGQFGAVVVKLNA